MADLLLQMEGVSKRYPGNGVQAVDGASLQVARGEIRAIVGENGAGKTTLMHIVTGVVGADTGSVTVCGRTLVTGDPAAARAAGVVMSYQHPRLDRSLTVLENLFLGDEPRRLGILFNRRRAYDRIRAVARDLPKRLVTRPLARLSSGQVRMVSLVAALLRLPTDRAGVLILDEPTEATTPEEADRIFQIIRDSAAAGHAVVFITHRLPEVGRVAHTVTVLRGGRIVGTYAADAGAATLAAAMVGSSEGEDTLHPPPAAGTHEPGPVRLRFERLTIERFGRSLVSDVSFSVRGGEVIGLTGIRENGIEAMEGLLAGKLSHTSGRFELDGRTVSDPTPNKLRSLGMRYVPTDRLLRGASVDSSVSENLIALKRRHLQRAGLFDAATVTDFAASLQRRFGIDAALNVPLWQLSGGNIQKVILSRELEGDPHMLVICEPSWGLDFRTRRRIISQVRRTAQAGAAVIVISTDIDEVIDLADRVLVLYDGRIVADVPASEASRQSIGRAMAGALAVGEPGAR